ncbi:phosphate ABC transporter permease PstA [soil metagenome]
MSTTITRPIGGREATTEAVRARLQGHRIDAAGLGFRLLLQLALALSLVILAVLLLDVVTGGWEVLTTRMGTLLSADLRSLPEEAGLFQGIRGSLWIAFFVVMLAFPVGIGAAIYLEEYAPRNRFTSFININVRNLAGVPSVVYGILGLAIFVKSLNTFTGGRTLMAAGVTLAILVLPIVIITASEAIRAVPDSLREAGFGVGATRWEVVRTQVLPYAAPGILTGTVLALARAVGEAAPLILVGAITGRLSSDFGVLDPEQVRERFTAMPIIITEWAGDAKAGFRPLTAAAIVVMLAFVLALNSVAILLRNRFEKKR